MDIDLNEIEFNIGQNKLDAASVFTKMLQHIDRLKKQNATLTDRLSSATQENERLIDLLDMVYTQYDGGTDCYEYSGGMQGAHIGTAITISPEDEDKIVAILNRERPKQPAPAEKEKPL